MDVLYVGHDGEIYKEFPKHHHGYWEIIYNKVGRGTMTVAGKSFGFEPGDIAIIPPEMVHQKVSEEGFSDICMFIDDFRVVGKEPFRILRDDEEKTVLQLMEVGLRYFGNAGTYERALLNAIGDLLYQIFVVYYLNNQQRDLRLEGILELMEKNVSNVEFDLSEAIEESGYCKGYFRRIFKEATGETPVNYFQKLRMDYAKSLIGRYGVSRSVADVAWESGFKDPLYFSRVFKKIEGMSPKEYIHRRIRCDVNQIVKELPDD